MSVIVVGLTGQSGAGKTTVCRAFRENGFAVINADTVAREVMKKDGKCLKETVKVFGDILTQDNELDRKKLAGIVFSDKEKLKRYEQIIFPYINAEIGEYIKNIEKDGGRYILLDAPTLFESGADKKCETVISVIADKKLRLSRIIERDGITEEQAILRISSQNDDEFYTEKSDYVIRNNQSQDELLQEADHAVMYIKERFNA